MRLLRSAISPLLVVVVTTALSTWVNARQDNPVSVPWGRDFYYQDPQFPDPIVPIRHRYQAPQKLPNVADSNITLVIPSKWFNNAPRVGLTWFWSEGDPDVPPASKDLTQSFFVGTNTNLDTLLFQPPLLWRPGTLSVGVQWGGTTTVDQIDYDFQFEVTARETLQLDLGGEDTPLDTWRVEATRTQLTVTKQNPHRGRDPLGWLLSTAAQSTVLTDTTWYEVGLPWQVVRYRQPDVSLNYDMLALPVVPVEKSSVGGWKARYRE